MYVFLGLQYGRGWEDGVLDMLAFIFGNLVTTGKVCFLFLNLHNIVDASPAAVNDCSTCNAIK